MNTRSRLTALASDGSLDAAFDWLCLQRRDWPDHADVWHLRVHWPASVEGVQLGIEGLKDIWPFNAIRYTVGSDQELLLCRHAQADTT